MSAPSTHAWPGPLTALGLTVLGGAIATATAWVARPHVTPTVALGLALVVGLGCAGALGAAYVPLPHAERIGLIRAPARRLLAALLLTPAVLWSQQAGHWIRAAFPPSDVQEVVARRLAQVPVDSAPAVLETLAVTVGIAPMVEEWFFRGVIQQGLVARAGAAGGIVTTALIFGMVHASVGDSPASWAAGVAQAGVLGLAFGYARHATGSLSAAILLHAAVNAVSLAALAYADTVPIPGFTAPAAHLPLDLLVPAAMLVAVGVWLLSREAPPPIPDPPRPDELPDNEDH